MLPGSLFMCVVWLWVPCHVVRRELHECEKTGPGRTWLQREENLEFWKGKDLCVLLKLHMCVILDRKMFFTHLKKTHNFCILVEPFQSQQHANKTQKPLIYSGFLLWGCCLLQNLHSSRISITCQQLMLYGVFLWVLLIKGLVLNWREAESDMLHGCVAVAKFSLVCSCAKFERFLVFTCHYFCSLLFEDRPGI